MRMTFCSNKSFFVHYKSKFLEDNSFSAELTFKLVANDNKAFLN